MSKVDVVLSHPWTDTSGKTPKSYDVDDRVSVDPEVAERLVRGGTGVPATKSDAEEVGAPPETARSVRK